MSLYNFVLRRHLYELRKGIVYKLPLVSTCKQYETFWYNITIDPIKAKGLKSDLDPPSNAPIRLITLWKYSFHNYTIAVRGRVRRGGGGE